MPTPNRPSPCRVHAFFDGQNVFHSVRRTFGYTFPNFDPLKLSQAVVARIPDRQLVQVHFYTGIPPATQDPKWSGFWRAKIKAMKSAGISVVTRTLRYSPGPVIMPDGTVQTLLIGREKGIDLRLALDLIRLARDGAFDAGLIFSQDGDLAEVVDEIRALRQQLNRWIVIDCAYPSDSVPPNRNVGIPGANPVPFTKALYDACIDPVNYFPPTTTPRLPGIP